MFKASGDPIIHTRHIDENEGEYYLHNGDERGELDEELSGCGFYRRKKSSPNIFQSEDSEDS